MAAAPASRDSSSPTHASISVPSTVKCSSLNKRCRFAAPTTAAKNACATSPCNSRSRFFEKLVASHTRSLIPSPTNQRNSRLYSSCSTSIRSERTEYNSCNSNARNSCSGGTDGRPSFEYSCSNRGPSSRIASSANARTRRKGCSNGTRWLKLP
jgi:hypothetical protein